MLFAGGDCGREHRGNKIVYIYVLSVSKSDFFKWIHAYKYDAGAGASYISFHILERTFYRGGWNHHCSFQLIPLQKSFG
jgi:hypothetical protein